MVDSQVCNKVRNSIHGQGKGLFLFYFSLYSQLIWSHTPRKKKRGRWRLSLGNFKACLQSNRFFNFFFFPKVSVPPAPLALLPPPLFWAVTSSYFFKGCDKKLHRLQIFDVVKCSWIYQEIWGLEENQGTRPGWFCSISWLNYNSNSCNNFIIK